MSGIKLRFACHLREDKVTVSLVAAKSWTSREMAIPVWARPCMSLPRVWLWKCAIRSRYAPLSLIYAARVHANLHQWSRLSIIVEGGNTCQQCRTIGIPRLNCAQYIDVACPRIQQMFSNVVRRVSFLLDGTPIGVQRIENYLCIFFLFFFNLRFLASFSCSNNRPRFSFSLSC